MKKIFIIAMLAMTASIAKAQLKVDSLGCTQIGGNIQPAYYNSTKVYDATINTSKSLGALCIRNFSNSTSRYGMNVQIESSDTSPVGINSWTLGSFNSSLSCGVKGLATGGSNPIGIAGGVEDDPGSINCIGVCGSMGYNAYLPTTGQNYYAGYFQGDVRATGSIYGTLLSPSSIASNPNNTTLIEPNNRTESVTDKLQKVALLQMERNNQDGSMAANREEEEVFEINLITPEKSQKIPISQKKVYTQTQLSSVSYGLAADQLREVYPELVYEDGQGNYSVNYVEMVPLLVQSIKELSAKVTILEEQLGIQETTKPVMKTKGKTEDADNVTLTFPDNAHEATLNIYDLSGKLLRTSPVNMAETRNLSTYTRGLPTGTYAYTLTVNGQKQKARKVVVKN